MNKSFCNTCRKLVPAMRVTRDGKVYLLKQCPTCGETETLVSADAARHFSKRDLDPGLETHGCAIHCTECRTHRRPTYAFVDVTNRCNLNCPMCADSVGGHGFVYEPPIGYLGKIFKHLAEFNPLPTIALFGGEPTVRPDLLEVIALARSYGFPVRVLTNGIRLADRDHCRALAKSGAHLLVSYDGCKPSTYLQLRSNAKVLEKKQKAVENLSSLQRARVSYVTCLAWGLNHKDLPEMLEFYHRQRHILKGVYLMPLVQTWDAKEFDYAPDRMTTEDVERFLAACFPEHNVQFIALGLASHFWTVAKYLGKDPFPYRGAHPNCESFYLLISNGEKYVPIDHFLTKPFHEVAGAMLKLEERLAAREKRWETGLFGRLLGAVRLRNFTLRQIGRAQIFSLLFRHGRIGRVFKGKGIGKVGHALMTGLELAIGRESRIVRQRHLNAHEMLPVTILPLEDNPIIETERLERCPSVHVYLDPKTDEFRYVPVCSWRMHNKQILSDLAAHFMSSAPRVVVAEPATVVAGAERQA